jgi:hypothetical protein
VRYAKKETLRYRKTQDIAGPSGAKEPLFIALMHCHCSYNGGGVFPLLEEWFHQLGR